MNEQLERIETKIEQLKKLDKGFKLFGSLTHRYKLNPTISIEKVRQFETTHNLTLPLEYVNFITQIGNGGVGPFYGLEPFENCLFTDLDYKRQDDLLNPSEPFRHNEIWNLQFKPTVDETENEEQYEKELLSFDELYFDKTQLNGVIAICNFGCAISLNLVVNGKEFGNIRTDDRASDNGIYPSRELGNEDKITFLNWYELWLDNSIKAVKSEQFDLLKQDKKSWWKFW